MCVNRKLKDGICQKILKYKKEIKSNNAEKGHQNGTQAESLQKYFMPLPRQAEEWIGRGTGMRGGRGTVTRL